MIGIKAILFDLDGTLLPMDQEVFMKLYFGQLAVRLAPFGYEPKTLIDSVFAGIKAMVKNDGSRTNEQAFWERFSEFHGQDCRKDEPIFDAFYRNEFAKAKEACGVQPKAKEVIEFLKAKGKTIILATNPLFPQIATENRIRWAGLSPEDFLFYTTYEHSSYCKPNPKYYEEILNRAGLLPEECLMVGNDVGEDMVAETIGINVFLLTDCLLNPKQLEYAHYPQGGFEELLEYIKELCQVELTSSI